MPLEDQWRKSTGKNDHTYPDTGGLALWATQQIERLEAERDTALRCVDSSQEIIGPLVAREARLREAIAGAADELAGATGLTPGDRLKIESAESLLRTALG
jgi:hypothetical protein